MPLIDAKEKQEYDRKWHKNFKETHESRNSLLRKQVFDFLGGRCSNPNCKWVNDDKSIRCTDFRCLQIDHINGGGTKEFKKLSYSVFLRKVLSSVIGEYQLLCANCNWIKRKDKKEFGTGRIPKPL